MADDAAVAALADHVVPLDPADPVASRDGLDAVSEIVDGAAVVGLGECLHGSRELFHLKRRLLRHLVADRGVRTLALEGDVAATAGLDDYVRHGDGDPTDLLADMVVWPWRTRELRAVVEYLRRFNEGRPAADRVRIVGLSPNDPARAADALGASVPTVAPGATDRAADALATVADGDLPDGGDRLADLHSTIEALRERLRGGGASSDPADDELARARLHCRAVAQALDWRRTRSEHDGPHEEGMAHRDRIMAANVLAALESDSGGGVAVWAHDSHVQRGTFDDGTVWTDAETMGERLDRELDGDYRPFGSEVARGTVRAKGAGEGGPTRAFDLGEPLGGSLAARLDAVGTSPAVVDLRDAAVDDRLAAWLAERPPTRRVGSVYDPRADPGVHYQATDLPASYDGLLFVAESTPTRSLSSG